MKKYICFSIILCWIFTGCHNDNDKEQEENLTRTLMVYIGRDNNLSDNIEEKIEYIRQGWDGTGGHIVIYQDKAGSQPELIEIYHEKGDNYLQVIETYEEENSADPAIFNKALITMKRLYPADSYGLIFFSHATGWLPEGVFAQTRSIGMDGSTEMELTEFAQAIPASTFDFIVFEACFMAGIEVLYELKDKTPYILASSAEILSPGFRNIYMNYINYLFRPEADLKNFAAKAFEWVNSQYGAYRSGTISLVNTSSLEQMAFWLSKEIDRDFEGNIQEIQAFDMKINHLFFDFYEYYSRLIPESGQATLQKLIDDCVIYKAATTDFFRGYTGGYTIDKHSGITTYIPQEQFQELNDAYKQLKWYKTVLTN